MFRKLSIGLPIGVSAVRLNVLDSATVDGAMGGMVMLETVSMANGFLNATHGAEANGSDCESLWHKDLNSLFMNRRVWGSGATACVYGAEDETGTTIAVKVGKPTESLAEWKSECGEMQLMRLKACQAGSDTLKMHEQYIPTCLSVGQTKDGRANFYAMHAGGTVAFRDLPKHNLDQTTKRAIFSQLVASIFSLHDIGYTHNDLHGQNIVTTKDYKLALIDFGSVKTLEAANTYGYKRDSNAIWRWGAVLFSCGEKAQWVPDLPNKKISTSERKSRAHNFHNCMKEKGADAETMAVFQQMTDHAIAQKQEQDVAALYKTSFVQEYLTPRKAFPWTKSDGCLAWSKQKWEDTMNEAQFGSHYKCETTPNWIRIRTKRGKQKKSQQCNSPDLHSACFSIKKEVGAACGGGLNPKVQCSNLPIGTSTETYTGACLKSSHPAYAVAQDWPR